MFKKLFGSLNPTKKKKTPPPVSASKYKNNPLPKSLRAKYGVASPAASTATTYYSAQSRLSSPAPSVNTPNAASPRKKVPTAKTRTPRGLNPARNNSIAALRRAFHHERVTIKPMKNAARMKVRRVFDDAASSIENNLGFLRRMLDQPVQNAATIRRYIKDLEQYRKYVAAQYFEWAQSRAWSGTGPSDLPVWPVDPRGVTVRGNLMYPSAYPNVSKKTTMHPSVQKAFNRQTAAVRREMNARKKKNANYNQLVNNVFSGFPAGYVGYVDGKRQSAVPIGFARLQEF